MLSSEEKGVWYQNTVCGRRVVRCELDKVLSMVLMMGAASEDAVASQRSEDMLDFLHSSFACASSHPRLRVIQCTPAILLLWVNRRLSIGCTSSEFISIASVIGILALGDSEFNGRRAHFYSSYQLRRHVKMGVDEGLKMVERCGHITVRTQDFRVRGSSRLGAHGAACGFAWA